MKCEQRVVSVIVDGEKISLASITARLGAQTALIANSQQWLTAVVSYKSGEIKYHPFPDRCPRGGGMLQLHFPSLSQEDVERTKKLQRRGHRTNVKDERKKQRERAAPPFSAPETSIRQAWARTMLTPPGTHLLSCRSLLVLRLPQLRFHHLAHRVFLGWYPPRHIRGGVEVQHRPAASFVRQAVLGPASGLPLPGLLPSLHQQNLLLSLPLRALLGQNIGRPEMTDRRRRPEMTDRSRHVRR